MNVGIFLTTIGLGLIATTAAILYGGKYQPENPNSWLVVGWLGLVCLSVGLALYE